MRASIYCFKNNRMMKSNNYFFQLFFYRLYKNIAPALTSGQISFVFEFSVIKGIVM
jgi:hypothetical protein